MSTTLPSDHRAPTATQPHAAREASATTEHHRVLIVDDNVDSAETLAMVLELAGHATRTAHDGAGALEAARAFAPDVVFLDIGLPGMDGYEVATRLRAEAGSELKLVALTGFAEDRVRTQASGFDLHLRKPISCAAVEDAIANAFGDGVGPQRR